jgi:hypothetical protein
MDGVKVATPRRLQIPPLRSFRAPVGMTKGRLVTAREIGDLDGQSYELLLREDFPEIAVRVTRYALVLLLNRIWQLRQNLSAER